MAMGHETSAPLGVLKIALLAAFFEHMPRGIR
jgi:hypothetical protein